MTRFLVVQVPKSNRELVEQVIDEADADDLHRIRIWVKSKDDMVCVSYKPADTTEPAETIVESFKVWIACNVSLICFVQFTSHSVSFGLIGRPREGEADTYALVTIK